MNTALQAVPCLHFYLPRLVLEKSLMLEEGEPDDRKIPLKLSRRGDLGEF